MRVERLHNLCSNTFVQCIIFAMFIHYTDAPTPSIDFGLSQLFGRLRWREIVGKANFMSGQMFSLPSKLLPSYHDWSGRLCDQVIRERAQKNAFREDQLLHCLEDSQGFNVPLQSTTTTRAYNNKRGIKNIDLRILSMTSYS